MNRQRFDRINKIRGKVVASVFSYAPESKQLLKEAVELLDVAILDSVEEKEPVYTDTPHRFSFSDNQRMIEDAKNIGSGSSPKIALIKGVREQTGLGLLEAKLLVEAWARHVNRPDFW